MQIAVSAEFVSAAADGSGGSSGGVVSSQSVTASVHPVCWYERSDTGAERAEWIDSGKAAEYLRFIRSGSVEEYKTHFPDYESYADDTEGYWYLPTCDVLYMAEDDKRSFARLKMPTSPSMIRFTCPPGVRLRSR
ncbi:hypothetical protein [Actinomyces sp.]|uniref:hypothetical protein n=1 Tax=Actinomyces sp. TaxID=29317 RepID=UPI0026DAEC20|nr:hypothetical protein [Actinomyces sp.]MDO4901189.1 hypothetical protein [Actinomyces sp.]